MRIIVPALLLAALAIGVAPAAADPTASSLYTMTCDGTAPFQVVGTGAAGHVVGSTSIAVLLSGDVTKYVDGAVDKTFSFNHPVQSDIPALTCSEYTEFENAQGQTIRYEYTNSRVILTPAQP